ncbi:hypothetical protein DICA3_C18998 [Diutina catenulata]
MSDAGRQNISDKVASAVKPESEKSTLEKIGDSVKGTMDNITGAATPDSEKSASQQASDKVFGK